MLHKIRLHRIPKALGRIAGHPLHPLGQFKIPELFIGGNMLIVEGKHRVQQDQNTLVEFLRLGIFCFGKISFHLRFEAAHAQFQDPIIPPGDMTLDRYMNQFIPLKHVCIGAFPPKGFVGRCITIQLRTIAARLFLVLSIIADPPAEPIILIGKNVHILNGIAHRPRQLFPMGQACKPTEGRRMQIRLKMERQTCFSAFFTLFM